MKRLLHLLARLSLVSLLFVPFSPLLHTAYQRLLEGIGGRPAEGYDSSSSLYAFLVLVIGTPGLALKKRGIAITTGILLFPGCDLFMTVVWSACLRTPRPSLANMAVSYGWLVTTHYLLPFGLWFACALREIEQLFRGDKPRSNV